MYNNHSALTDLENKCFYKHKAKNKKLFLLEPICEPVFFFFFFFFFNVLLKGYISSPLGRILFHVIVKIFPVNTRVDKV